MDQPLVTFVSPSYNHSKYVIESLESIRCQDYPNIQHIIIDDCSRDDSVEKIQKWIDRTGYRCEFIRHKKNRGLSATLNESIEMAKGEFWTPLASDDFVVPDRTTTFVNFLQEHPDYGMCASDTIHVNADSIPVLVNGTYSNIVSCTSQRELFDLEKEFGTFRSLFQGNYMPASLMIRTNVFNRIGKFNEALRVEDWDMWLRISKQFKIGLVNRELTYYRVHEASSMLNPLLQIDLAKTQLSQFRYCKSTGLTEEYRKAYERHFHSYFSITRNPGLSWYFFRMAPSITVKTVLSKLLKYRKNKRLHE